MFGEELDHFDEWEDKTYTFSIKLPRIELDTKEFDLIDVNKAFEFASEMKKQHRLHWVGLNKHFFRSKIYVAFNPKKKSKSSKHKNKSQESN